MSHYGKWVHTHKNKFSGGRYIRWMFDRWTYYDQDGIPRVFIWMSHYANENRFDYATRYTTWTRMPHVRNPAEAKATALANWRME